MVTDDDAKKKRRTNLQIGLNENGMWIKLKGGKKQGRRQMQPSNLKEVFGMSTEINVINLK